MLSETDFSSHGIGLKVSERSQVSRGAPPAGLTLLQRVHSRPTFAQFLNVIESIFSGMSRAIIRNSNYPSLESAKTAIDRYFAERIAYVCANPKRAGKSIWGEERVPSTLSEGHNCKDSSHR